jgi:hypothetical protein
VTIHQASQQLRRRCKAEKVGLKSMSIRELQSFLLVAIFSCIPAHSAQIVPAADRDVDVLREQAFIAYKANYLELRSERIRRAVSLGRRVLQMEAQGQKTACAHQILTETKWLLGDTADFPRIDQRLDALEKALDHPDLEDTATEQDKSDGSWVAAIRNGSSSSTQVTNTSIRKQRATLHQTFRYGSLIESTLPRN